MATKYVFMAGGDACGACSALAGTISDVPMSNIHENCKCDSIPLTAGEDCPTYTANHVGNQHYGPKGRGVIMYFELEVTCCGGETIGEEFEIDLGSDGGRLDEGFFDEIDADLDLEAEGLAEGCPDPSDDLVC